ncbi:hypothetical protein [Enhygromyxa salina]|uniref:Uncharacterized protein n=1 Tax=Enhygromyxa salina TaxID=215803 RepID=A0A2S9YTY0_9BACT|nr:hypothetical protein [Enhygromyxa salina]PRQ08492.1 hypothetical protein ENSA7_17780 [Enhygromyxa salina]
MTRIVGWIVAAGLALPSVAIAAPPVEGPRAAADADEPDPSPVGTLSQQGTRQGVLELGIGVLLTGAGAGLIGFGTQQFIRAREHVEYCRGAAPIIDESGPTGIDPCMFDPPPLGFASAGLSWGFSLPLLVGAGMLFARGARIAGDARRYQRTKLSLSPWWQRRGAGASVVMRF